MHRKQKFKNCKVVAIMTFKESEVEIITQHI